MPYSYTDTNHLEEVVVTAQKKTENLMDVPLSITTRSNKEMQNLFRAGADIRALSGQVPSLYVESSNGKVAPRFYIRGLGNSDFDLSASQPVSVIMDGVVMENVILRSFPIFDIEQLEVLRGPQGTLFGRNTTAGIVKFTSRKPTHETEGYMTLTAGQLGTIDTETAIGGSLNDTLSGRISILSQQRANYINNGHTHKKNTLGGFKDTAFRSQLLWQPSDNLSTLASLHGRNLEGTSAIFHANMFTKGSNKINSNYKRDTVYFDGGNNNQQMYQAWGGNLTIHYYFSDLQLTTIHSLETTNGSSRADVDGGNKQAGPYQTAFPSDTKDELNGFKQWSHELRLANTQQNSINWQTGLYVFDSGYNVVTTSYQDNLIASATEVKHDNKLWAIFGQVDVHPEDNITIIAGLRYTYDQKHFSADNGNIKKTDGRISGDLSLSLNLIDDQLIYTRYANGFRGPSIQGRNVAFGGKATAANPETVNSLELGYKGKILGNRLRLNSAIFIYMIDNMQLTAVGGEDNTISLMNANKGTGKGFEIDLEWLLIENLLLSTGFSYNNTALNDPNTLVKICNSCSVTNKQVGSDFAHIDGNPFPNAPETTANFSLDYNFGITNDAELFFNTDWSYQGKTNLFLYESKEFHTNNQFEGAISIGYRRYDGILTLTIFGKNFTDENNVQGAIDFNNLTGFTNDPRIVGISISSAF